MMKLVYFCLICLLTCKVQRFIVVATDEAESDGDGYYYYYNDHETNVKDQSSNLPDPDEYKSPKPPKAVKIDHVQVDPSILKLISADSTSNDKSAKDIEKENNQVESETSEDITYKQRSSVAEMRALFERNQAIKEKERTEREEVRRLKQQEQYQKSLESKRKREREISELMKEIGATADNRRHFYNEEESWSGGIGKVNAELESAFARRKQEEKILEKAMEIKARKRDQKHDSEVNKMMKKENERISLEVDVFGASDVASEPALEHFIIDYPEKVDNVKASNGKKGFIKNTIPFIIDPPTPLLNAYFPNLSEFFSCLTREGLEYIYRNDPGRGKLYTIASEKDVLQIKLQDSSPDEEDVQKRKRRTVRHLRDDILEKVHRQDREKSIWDEKRSDQFKGKDSVGGTFEAAVAAMENDRENRKQTSTDENGKTDTKKVEKKLSFREKEAIKKKEKEEMKKLQMVSLGRAQSGPVCEEIVCGACRVVVEEFGLSVVKAIDNRDIQYVHEVASDFCTTSGISLRYGTAVMDVCNRMLSRRGYSRILVKAFEDDVNTDWEMSVDTSLPALVLKQQAVCVECGACQLNDMQYIQEAQTIEEREWTPSCFVCRAVFRNVQERLFLLARVSEASAQHILKTSCDYMALSLEHDTICRSMVEGTFEVEGKPLNINQLGWQLKSMGESISRKDNIDLPYPEKLCLDLKMCNVYIDEAMKELKELKTLEAVYA